MKRLCPECSSEIFGRIDKKFCSDSCRNNYNNRLNSGTSNFIRSINRTLKKNRRILAELNPKGKTKLHKNKLITAGFNFNYHTNVYQTKSGKTYYFCYDQGYLSIDEDYVALVVRQEYVE